MFNFKVLKFSVGVLTVLWMFFGEIASTFSFKREPEAIVAGHNVIPFTHRLNNTMSASGSTAAIDSIFSAFIQKRGIKGASVSVTDHGRLVYAKGFGYADEELGIGAEPFHLFRIASVSKLITAVAVMKLKEAGKLDLEDKVFGPDGVLNDSLFLQYKDARVESITVQQLLSHTAGWRHKGRDPLFRSLEIKRKMGIKERDLTMDDIILFVLAQKLDYNPGSRYSYSNFGYALLGKVIEKASGMSYEKYVNYDILQPLGIYDMHIGRSFMQDQLMNEARYYDMEHQKPVPAFNGNGTMVPITYGANSLELLWAAGGWLASSPELIKLVCAIDGFPAFPDLLSESLIEEMVTPVKRSSHLFGWRGADGYGTWWRTGTLSGSIALVMRYRNETNWVVLLNTSPVKRKRIHNEISQAIYKAMQEVDNWPEVNLFMN